MKKNKSTIKEIRDALPGIQSEKVKRVFSPSHIEKLILSHLGQKPSYGTLGKKFPNRKKPIPMSDETKRKIGLASKGNKHNLGRKQSQEEKDKRVVSIKKTYDKKGRKTEINQLIRTSLEYKLWRTAVFERDNYTCIWCGQHGGNLQADHIKPFAFYPELRFAIDNGRTLCVTCHRTTDTFGRPTNI